MCIRGKSQALGGHEIWHCAEEIEYLSDHKSGVAFGSIALGATIIEKHFTTSREVKSVDSQSSIDEGELRRFVQEAGRVSLSLGSPHAWHRERRKQVYRFRRSIYASKAIRRGDI